MKCSTFGSGANPVLESLFFRHILTFSLLLFAVMGLQKIAISQNKPGVWTPHLAFTIPFKVVEAPGKIYFATQGGIFYFNQSDNSIGSLTKNEGLSEIQVKALGYNKSAKTLVIVYESGGVDLYSENGSIFPMTDLKRKNIPGNKTVNRLYMDGNLCYMACGFGIVVLDVARREFKDTYIIGPNGSYMNVNHVSTDQNNIYAATPIGLLKASLSTNLLDYSNWVPEKDPDLPEKAYFLTYYHNETVYAITKMDNHEYGDYAYYKKGNDKWRRAWWPFYAFSEMEFVGNDVVVVASDYEVNVYSTSTAQHQRITNYPFKMPNVDNRPNSVVVDELGTVWIADINYGAIRFKNDLFEKIEPSGPKHNSVAALTYSNDMLWVSRGGITKAWGNAYQPPLLQFFDGQKWGYFDRTNTPEIVLLADITSAVPVPGKKDHAFAVAYGYGLLEFKQGKMLKFYDHTNSNLLKIPLSDTINNIVRIGGLTYDRDGNLWMSNSYVEKNLHCYKPDGTWKSFSLPEIANNYNVGKLIFTKNDQIWMIVPRGVTKGLYVMSADGSRKKHLDVKSYFSNTTDTRIQTMNDVYDLVEDIDGRIWVGTSQGVITYSNPLNVFDTDPYYGFQPAVDQNDGIYHPLLETEQITALAVDGANQKWIGTGNAGIYLVSADGTKELFHFTTENSPLISNAITSLAYDGDHGVLYIGTANGLVSYNTQSRNANNAFANVYAYPNPVRPEYKGDIHINGLMYNTNVKITTISGKLVYETTSEGGQAVWPGTDLAGNRVHSGVYMVFLASEDGKQSEVTKILFIR